MLIENLLQWTYLPDLMTAMAFMIMNVLVERIGIWPYSLATFPGTLLHELSHYFAALILFAEPSLPNLWPKREGNTWTMGSVRFYPSLLNPIPIALAPLLLLPGSLLVLERLMHDATGWWYVFYGWTAGNMAYACFPSRQDWKIAMPALVIVALCCFCFWYAAR